MSNNVIKITLMKTFKKFYFLPKGAMYAYDVYATSERKSTNKMKTTTIIFTLVGSLLVVYLGGSFISGTMNPFELSAFNRLLYILVFILLTGMIFSADTKHDENEVRELKGRINELTDYWEKARADRDKLQSELDELNNP